MDRFVSYASSPLDAKGRKWFRILRRERDSFGQNGHCTAAVMTWHYSFDG